MFPAVSAVSGLTTNVWLSRLPSGFRNCAGTSRVTIVPLFLFSLKIDPPAPGVIDKTICQNRVVDRFPEVLHRTWRHPIAVEGPNVHQVATLPGEFVLVPRLRGEGPKGDGAGLRHHINVIAIDQRRLIVGQKITAGLCLLVRHVWVVDNICQNAVWTLAGDIQKTSVLRVLRPLGPFLPECFGQSKNESAKNNKQKGEVHFGKSSSRVHRFSLFAGLPGELYCERLR